MSKQGPQAQVRTAPEVEEGAAAKRKPWAERMATRYDESESSSYSHIDPSNDCQYEKDLATEDVGHHIRDTGY